jgi:IS5 family transposase
VAQKFFSAMQAFLDRHGKVMHGGSIVDATIVQAPTSTKNAKHERDPEMHSVRKGNVWYFGERLHIGVDAGSGYVHAAQVTPANRNERDLVPDLVREDDHTLYGDAGYTGLEKREEILADAHLRTMDFRMNLKNRFHWKSLAPGFDWDRQIERAKSRVRSKVEYVFFVIKRIFGYRKVRYRGLSKNQSHALFLCTSANLYMLGRSGWRPASS